MARIVLGMDIGGTKSHAVLADDTGKILGEGVGGSGNINFIPLEMAEQSFTEAITTAQKQAGIRKLETELAIIGIEPQPDPLIPCITRLAHPKKIMRKEEGECSLVAGLVEKVGLALIVGTGSVAWGRNAAGQTHVTSCWGPIGDEGSAYWLAERGLNAAFYAEDRRGPYTKMHAKVLEKLGGGPSIRKKITLLYTTQDFRKEVADHAKVVTELATADPPDPVMREIVDEGAEHIVHMAATCAEVLGLQKGPYKVVAGSLLLRVPYYYEQVREGLRRRHSQATIVDPRFTPGVGAALIALDMIGVPWSDEVIGNVEATARKQE
jgi:N-acetylglucosamine kinase-like BadF-type ATPase